MNIGIFETDHFEFAYSLYRIFDYRVNKIYFFVNQTMHEQLKRSLGRAAEKCYWFVKEESDTLNFFMNKVKQVIDNEEIKLLFLNSIYSNYGKYASFVKTANTKTIVTIHNINNWLKSGEKGFNAFLDKRSKKKIIKNSAAINVFGDKLKDYFLSEYNNNINVLTIPYSIYEHSKIPEITNDYIQFVIPGSIDPRRKDYHSVLEVFEKITPEVRNITLTLAGKPVWDYGLEIISKCKKLKEQGVPLNWHDDFVKQSEFEKIMHDSDVIIAPVNREMPFSEDNEIYGLTKATGATFDMARYAKPGIIPEFFNVPSELNGSLMKYSTQDELADLIKNIAADSDYLTRLKLKALSNSHNYSVDVIREKIEPEIEELFKSLKW